MRKAFTLLEVIIAVMIISIVIMSLLKVYSNNIHIFNSLKQQVTLHQYTSLFMTSKRESFESKYITLDTLLDDFNLENDLRHKLKQIKVKVLYKDLEFSFLNEQHGTGIDLISGVGSDTYQLNGSSIILLRLKSQ